MRVSKVKLTPVDSNKTYKTGDFIDFKMLSWNKKNYLFLKSFEGSHLSDNWFLLEANLVDNGSNATFTLVKLSNVMEWKINLSKIELVISNINTEPIKVNELIPFHLARQSDPPAEVFGDFGIYLLITVLLLTLFLRKKLFVRKELAGLKEMKELKKLVQLDNVDIMINYIRENKILLNNKKVSKLNVFLLSNIYKRSWDQGNDEEYDILRKELLDS